MAAVALIYTLSNIYYYGEEEDYNYNSYANHSNVTIANNNNTKNVTNDSPPSSVGNINSNFPRREKEARDNDTDVTATSAKEYNDNERRSRRSSSSETTPTSASPISSSSLLNSPNTNTLGGGTMKEQEKPAIIDSQNGNWTYYNGDINQYYNKLEQDEHSKRNPNVITSYAVHRWMGPNGSTLVHYELVRGAIYEFVLGKLPVEDESSEKQLRVFDAGCGLGPGLMWFEQYESNWSLVGHTISETQYKWIVEDLPPHKFKAKLRSYDEPLENKNEAPFNAIYSIEAAIHSPNLQNSLRAWSQALLPGGVIIIIDDFLSVGVSRDDPDVDLFVRSWIANAAHSTTEISLWADQMDMVLVRDRDLGSEYQIIKRNYRNKAPQLKDGHGRVHQGWLGSKVRQKLMVEGKISYRLIVLQKKGVPEVLNGAAAVSAISSETRRGK